MSGPVPYWSDDRVALHVGDCLDVLAAMESASVDAVVTDPPYALPGGFMGKSWDAYDGREDAAFAYWLAGLIDGEGHFAITAHARGTHAPAFALKMRADEEGTLQIIRRTLRIGSITHERREPNPMVKWVVQDKAGCQRLVDLLDKYPLRAKKRMDYATWREAVCEWTDRPRGNRWHGAADNSRMAALRGRLMTGRQYVEPAWSGHEFQDWCRLWAAECLRVLKPGGYMLAFGGTRTSHRLTCAIEDAGFEIRDSIADLTGREAPGLMWAYGSGFPKNHNVSAAIDKAAGASREVVGYVQAGESSLQRVSRVEQGYRENMTACEPSAIPVTVPATEDAAKWAGWGTALKPAWEPVAVGRKPLAGTVAANVLEHGTGALNIAACRVGTTKDVPASPRRAPQGPAYGDLGNDPGTGNGWDANTGRWPANVLLTHSAGCRELGTRDVRSNSHHPAARGAGGVSTSGHAGQERLDERRPGTETVADWHCAPDCPVAELDRQSGVLTSGANPARRSSDKFRDAYGDFAGQQECVVHRGADKGGASRFFPVFRYEAKARSTERPRGEDGTAHPTVKPVDLMAWLVRLVTPPGGLVLDPFGGSGTTAEACLVEGFRCVLVEKDPAYAELIRTRLRKDIQPVMFGAAS